MKTIGAVILYVPGMVSPAEVNVAIGTPAYRYAVAQNYNIELRDTIVTGSCGDSAVWTFDYEAGTLTISGSGAMADYAYSSASANAAPYACTMLNFRDFVTKIVIGKDITSIGEYAFYSMTKAVEVEFEAGSALSAISAGAFGYSGLTSIEIPASVTTIEKNAFYFCGGLETVAFEEGSQLTSVGSYAFRNCTALTTCNIPAGASIGANVFYGCQNLVK